MYRGVMAAFSLSWCIEKCTMQTSVQSREGEVCNLARLTVVRDLDFMLDVKKQYFEF